MWYVCPLVCLSGWAWGFELGRLGVLAPLPPCARAFLSPNTLRVAAHRVVMDTLRIRLGFIRGLTLLSRHHSPSLSIVDDFSIKIMNNYYSYDIPFTGKQEPNKLTCSQLYDFVAQLVRALHRYRRGHGFESR